MRTRCPFPAFLLVSVSFAMAGTAEIRDPEAVEVLAASLGAMTQATRRLPSDVEVTGLIRFANGDLGDLKIQVKGRSRLRNELRLAGKELTAIFNNGSGRRYDNGRERELPRWVTAYASADFLPVVSRLADFENPNLHLAYLGIEKDESGEVYHVRLWAAPIDDRPAEIEELMSEYHVFIETTSLLPVRIRTYIFSPEVIENRSPVDYYYGDYRQVGDILVPFEIQRFVSEQFDSRTTIETARVDSGLSDSLFDF